MRDYRGVGAKSLGRRDRRKQATRRQLILAGRKLFSSVGLYEARIEDLAEDAGIAKGTLYLYFRNRDELACEVVTIGYRELQASVTDRICEVGTLPMLVRRIVEAHFAFFAENPDLQRILHQARGMLKFDRPEWRRLRAPLREHIAFLAEALALAPSPLRRRRAARWSLAIELFGSVSGVASVRTALGTRGAYREVERALAGNLARLPGARSSRS
ncbi:MAG: TetR/AcrR family transcriptional regulator [Candidatus Eiseniibacteriota bacterium]